MLAISFPKPTSHVRVHLGTLALVLGHARLRNSHVIEDAHDDTSACINKKVFQCLQALSLLWEGSGNKTSTMVIQKYLSLSTDRLTTLANYCSNSAQMMSSIHARSALAFHTIFFHHDHYTTQLNQDIRIGLLLSPPPESQGSLKIMKSPTHISRQDFLSYTLRFSIPTLIMISSAFSWASCSMNLFMWLICCWIN